MRLHAFFFAAALALAGSAAFAANTPAPGAGSAGGPMKGGMCKQDAQECQALAGKFDQWCSANADKCTAMKAHIEKHREWCEANKDKCKEMMQRMHKRRGQGQQGDDSDDDDTSSPPSA